VKTQSLWQTQKGALPSEMVSLSERLSLMLIVRTAIVAVALGSGLFGISIQGGSKTAIVVISAVYLGMSVAVEAVRRVAGGRGLVTIGVMLLVDGLFLAWVTYATGGAHSPLRFLMYAHLISVTLLASYRTGLKIALWHSLLVFVMFYAQLAAFIDPVEVQPGTTEVAQSPFHRLAVYNLMAFWFVAIATAVFSAFNERNLRRRGFDLEALALLATEMDKVTDTVGAMRCLTDVAADTFSFEKIAVLLLRDGELSVVAERNCGPSPTSNLLGDAVIQTLQQTQRETLVNALDQRGNPALWALFPEGKRMVLCPLVVEGAWVGAIVAQSSSKRAYRLDSSVLTIVGQFATHAALALSNVWLLEQVQKLADTDSLTGVGNRMKFDRVLSAEMNRADRSGEAITLLMVDVDHFKSLNDRFGHQGGDEILRMLATALEDACRDFDTVARYGGEEFAVILPATDTAAGAPAGERFRRLVEELETPVSITASVGVATYPACAWDKDSLVRAADEALYASKRAGRNRVTQAPERWVGRVVAG
jgi:two-component system, cell cycle response regulator